jgi:uncharacterized DUF497 family protein
MVMAVAGIGWDEGNRGKCQKHGVSLVVIEHVPTADPRFAPDVGHSVAEDRFIAVGRAENGRPVFVAFTFRVKDGRMFVRPVSARYMHGKEVEHYEKASSQAED